MKLLCLTKYTRQGPSSRYRVYQFLPYLEDAGIDVHIQTLHDDGYLNRMFAGRRASLPYLLNRWLKRVSVLLRAGRYDLVFIQKELFPHLPDLFETVLRWCGVEFVLDIDDAIFVLYEDSKSVWTKTFLRDKLPRVIKKSRLVLAGNGFLEGYARRYSQRVVRFPTVVDTQRFTPRDGRISADLPVVGWMGSPETVRFVDDLRGPLEALSREIPYEMRIVGADPRHLEGVPVTAQPWSEAGEVDALRWFDVGIMPLSDSRWAQGKCGLKLLQYMSVGVASVSSPVGSARDIISDGDNGFLASNPAEWVEKIGRLLRDSERRRVMGRRGRETVEREYSLQALGPRLAELLLEASGRSV
ncbi:MAG: glycosyltransferase family 4 protein [Candidatus Latescibacterota bacterium]|nr:MAG: glycosyltransferase family 4 protein [Candidatus Latescibacterota bacterium]